MQQEQTDIGRRYEESRGRFHGVLAGFLVMFCSVLVGMEFGLDYAVSFYPIGFLLANLVYAFIVSGDENTNALRHGFVVGSAIMFAAGLLLGLLIYGALGFIAGTGGQ